MSPILEDRKAYIIFRKQIIFSAFRGQLPGCGFIMLLKIKTDIVKIIFIEILHNQYDNQKDNQTPTSVFNLQQYLIVQNEHLFIYLFNTYIYWKIYQKELLNALRRKIKCSINPIFYRRISCQRETSYLYRVLLGLLVSIEIICQKKALYFYQMDYT